MLKNQTTLFFLTITKKYINIYETKNKDQKDNQQQEVYVVARDRRRTSEWNFTTEEDAKQEAQYWIGICKTMIHLPKFQLLKLINLERFVNYV